LPYSFVQVQALVIAPIFPWDYRVRCVWLLLSDLRPSRFFSLTSHTPCDCMWTKFPESEGGPSRKKRNIGASVNV